MTRFNVASSLVVLALVGAVFLLCRCSASPPEPTDSTSQAAKHRDAGVPDAPVHVPPPVCADCTR